jgi:uncharacterized protein YndB with AHSA1/START domain
MIQPDGTVQHVLRIHADPEIVWEFWTDPVRLCEWWATEAEVQARPGGACRIDLGRGAVMRGEFVEVEPFERLVFTFGWEPVEGAPNVLPGQSHVEVTLTPDDDHTILTLRHTGLRGDAIRQHDDGWSHFLPLLVDAVGRDFRLDQST